MNISLKKMAVWLPETFETSDYIANESGIPKNVIEEKMGIIKKCRASKEIQPSLMAINAAKSVLEGIDPNSIDLVIWTGSEYKDHNVWSAGIYVQEKLKLKNAWAFDMAARCSTNVVGIKVAKAMMQTHKKINRVLLCGGHKTGDLVNYQDKTSRFLYNLSDGGSAILLEKGDENPILDCSVITDGAFSKDVIIKAGGSLNPWRGGAKDLDSYLTCPDIVGMRDRLAAKSLDNFIKVIKDAAKESFPNRPIDYMALLHMKKSAHDEIVNRLELKSEQSIYLDQYGHFGAPDQVLSLGLAERRNLLNPGDHVVLASAGIGYTWSSLSLRWDHNCFVQKTLDNFEI
jgi:3-oxoacyl-[acyl-carrier-protein] synthase-3